MLPFPYILLIPDFWLIFAFIVTEIFIVAKCYKAINVWIIFSLFLGSTGYILLTFTKLSANFFYSSYQISPLTNLVKAVMALSLCLIFIYSLDNRKYYSFGNEFYLLAMSSLFGQFLMIGGNDFLILYLGLEIMSLALYAMVGNQSDPKSSESSFKYYVLGALASGILLYGISMIYGATGTWQFGDVQHVMRNDFSSFSHVRIVNPLISTGILFILLGLVFKFGAAPFHMWLPDVYQGSKTVTTMLVAGSPKVAILVIAMRLLCEVFGKYAVYWQSTLSLVIIMSLIIGCFLGLIQKNIKRMFAYSAILNQGFILVGLICADFHRNLLPNFTYAYAASLFFSLTYLISTLAFFAIVMFISSNNENGDVINSFNGLAKKSPWLAFLMLILIFSIAGIPPTVGFFSKLLIISTSLNAEKYALSLLLVVTSLIAMFYYLQIIRVMYFELPVNLEIKKMKFWPSFILTLHSCSVLIFGLWPDPLMRLCHWTILNGMNLSLSMQQ